MSTITSYVSTGLTRKERRKLANHFMGRETLPDDSEMQAFLDDLDDDEKEAVEDVVMQDVRVVQQYDILYEIARDGDKCVHCGGDDVVRFGLSGGRQRFKCHECGKFFTEFTNTPLGMCKKPEKFAQFTDRDKSKTVRDLADEYDISTQTVIRWKRIEEQLNC